MHPGFSSKQVLTGRAGIAAVFPAGVPIAVRFAKTTIAHVPKSPVNAMQS